MGLTTRLMEQRSTSTLKDPAKWLIDAFGGLTVSSGVVVTPYTARKIVAVMCAVRIIAESIASLPLFIYKRRPNGQKGRDKQTSNPLHTILHDQPNPWQTSFEWIEMMTGHVCLRGNAYSEILYNGRGGVRMLVPRHPDRMKVYDVSNASIGDQTLAYEYSPSTGPSRILFADEVLHLKGISDDGLVGMSPVHEFAESLGLAIGTERYAGKFFANYGNPGGVLTHPKQLSPDAAKRIREQWEAKHTGVENAHRVAVLEEGLTWTSIGVDPKASQLLESRQFSIAEIARIFRVPPHMLADLSRATFSNIEHQSIEFVMHTLRPWLVRWEKRLALSLLTPSERASGLFMAFKLEGLLRGDSASRFSAYRTGREIGVYSANDIRDLENMNPRDDPDGDAYLSPMNMSSSNEQKDEPDGGAQTPPTIPANLPSNNTDDDEDL